jgi:hypothetical protein
MRLIWLVCAWLVGCSLETAERGQACQRTAQCALGLACVRARCTTDLRSVAEGNTVPNLGGGAGGAGEAGAAGDAAGAAGSN